MDNFNFAPSNIKVEHRKAKEVARTRRSESLLTAAILAMHNNTQPTAGDDVPTTPPPERRPVKRVLFP